MHKVVVFTNPECRLHRPGPRHPESPDRLRAALAGVPPEIERFEAPAADPRDLLLAHAESHVARIRDLCAAGRVVHVDPDTVLSPGAWPAALGAVGVIRGAIESVINRRARRVFGIVRPPGHHAGRDCTSGFCFFNTMAIGVRILQREYGLRRIAVIDWDAHHGNGTQAEFFGEAGVLYISIHQFPLFPGSGRRVETGSGEGRGTTLNIPMAAGSTDTDMLRALDGEVARAIAGFEPELILISAGFDGHVADPLAALMMTERGYYEATIRVCGWAERFCGGRIVSLLEGGYDPQALEACVAAHLRALDGGEARY